MSLKTVLRTGNTGYSIPSDLFMNFPGSHKKVWKLWAWLINALKYIWQIIRQTTRGKNISSKGGKKVRSLLAKLLNVSNRGTFGFVRIKEVDGLLGAARNEEEKWFCGVSELMDGSGRLREACVWHGRILQAGEGWFIGLMLPVKVLTASVRHLLGRDSASSPVRCPQNWTSVIPTRGREAFAGHGPRRGYAARGSGGGSLRLCRFWGRCRFASLPPNFPRAKPLPAFLYGLCPCRKKLVSLIFQSLVRKKEKLSREGSAGWDF